VVPLYKERPCCTEKDVFVEGEFSGISCLLVSQNGGICRGVVSVEGWSFRGGPLYCVMACGSHGCLTVFLKQF
jgi:hypothetical protein